MSLIVEDGTAKANAESYISVTDASTYHANRGNASWPSSNATQCEQLLRKATDYMLQVYRTRWQAFRTTTTQALDWPRYGVEMRDGPGGLGSIMPAYYPSNSVPTAVANACAELALKALAGDLTPDLTQAIKSKTVGALAIEYQDYSQATKTYRAIDNLLAPLLAAGSGVRVIRA